MDRYIDIQILPDPEFSQPQLMSALFSKLHRALAELKRTDIGLSFPKVHSKGLGDCLRLHGAEEGLTTLMALDWLKGMRDHSDVASIRPAPDAVQYRVVRRVQVDSSPERLHRRLVRRAMARDGITEDQALSKISVGTSPKRLDLPFVSLRSQSTGQSFKLFIEHGPLQSVQVEGGFSAYGLSSCATVPWWP